jgi:hypothetical protein
VKNNIIVIEDIFELPSLQDAQIFKNYGKTVTFNGYTYTYVAKGKIGEGLFQRYAVPTGDFNCFYASLSKKELIDFQSEIKNFFQPEIFKIIKPLLKYLLLGYRSHPYKDSLRIIQEITENISPEDLSPFVNNCLELLINYHATRLKFIPIFSDLLKNNLIKNNFQFVQVVLPILALSNYEDCDLDLLKLIPIEELENLRRTTVPLFIEDYMRRGNFAELVDPRNVCKVILKILLATPNHKRSHIAAWVDIWYKSYFFLTHLGEDPVAYNKKIVTAFELLQNLPIENGKNLDHLYHAHYYKGHYANNEDWIGFLLNLQKFSEKERPEIIQLIEKLNPFKMISSAITELLPFLLMKPSNMRTKIIDEFIQKYSHTKGNLLSWRELEFYLKKICFSLELHPFMVNINPALHETLLTDFYASKQEIKNLQSILGAIAPIVNEELSSEEILQIMNMLLEIDPEYREVVVKCLPFFVELLLGFSTPSSIAQMLKLLTIDEVVRFYEITDPLQDSELLIENWFTIFVEQKPTTVTQFLDLIDVWRDSYYKFFGIPVNAEEKIIREARNRLALFYHPDKGNVTKEESEHFMPIVNEVYQTLSDSQKRQEYDNYLKNQCKAILNS